MRLSNIEIMYTIALTQSKGIGINRSKKLINAFSGAENVYLAERKELVKRTKISARILVNFPDNDALELAKRELEFIENNNIDFYRFDQEDYPFLLKQLIDSPVFLLFRGDYKLNFDRAISIVGTRNMTNYGKNFCEQLINDISEFNPTIVSGLAYGVDVWAHKVALKNGLQNFSVVAHGLNQIYPKSHLGVAREIIKNGALLSEFLSTSKPDRENFPQRNRIIAGLTKTTIVIEASNKGGALITADLANDYNRDVFALPGRVDDVFSEGCNNLIKNNKAILLSSSDDLIKYFSWQDSLQKNVIQKSLFVETTFEEDIVIKALTLRDMGLDELSLEIDIPTYKLVGILLELELKSLVRPLPGKIFRLN